MAGRSGHSGWGGWHGTGDAGVAGAAGGHGIGAYGGRRRHRWSSAVIGAAGQWQYRKPRECRRQLSVATGGDGGVGADLIRCCRHTGFRGRRGWSTGGKFTGLATETAGTKGRDGGQGRSRWLGAAEVGTGTTSSLVQMADQGRIRRCRWYSVGEAGSGSGSGGATGATELQRYRGRVPALIGPVEGTDLRAAVVVRAVPR